MQTNLCILCVMLIKIIAAMPADLNKYPHYFNLMKMAEDAVVNCYEDDANMVKVEITEAGFEGMLKSLKDPPRNTKCLRYCIMRKNELFNEDNHLNHDEMLEFFKKLYNDTVGEDLVKNVVKECREKAGEETDRCESAHVGAMCIITRLNEQGVLDI